MLRMKEYCERVRDDAYGGSVELVEDGILAMCNEIEAEKPATADAVLRTIEGYVDDILAVTSPILPLINLLDLCMRYADENSDGTGADDLRKGFVERLAQRKAEQGTYVEKIGKIGANLIEDGDKVSTFSTSGSVMAIYETAVKQGKAVSAAAFEARPHAEGYRTLKEVSALGVPVTFGCDALLCQLIPGSKFFVIGADAITSTGEVFAKTGSYLAALACREYGIPFYVAADTSKFSPMTLLGYPTKDLERPASEVSPEPAPEGSRIRNISFELIPARLVSGILCEKGLISPAAVGLMMDPDKMSAKMVKKLEAWMTEDHSKALL